MKKRKESFEEFKEKALHEDDDLFAIFFLNPITIRIAYFIKKYNLNITPNQITLLRLFLFSPLIILCLFLAPFLQSKIFYLFAIIFSYFFLLSDWLDGQLARGTGKISYTGILFDSIADRFSTIIFITLLFSIGLWFNNSILLYGVVLLFVLKTFHLMIITKIFYYGEKTTYLDKVYTTKKKSMKKIFSGEEVFRILGVTTFTSFLKKLNSVLKIKRWEGRIGGSERYLVTIILPLIFITFGWEIITIYFSYFLMAYFLIFFLIRIKNLLKF
jgi:phosphatidylglycerophosphate synthase